MTSVGGVAWELFTDASLTGWGAILTSPLGHCAVVGGPWSAPESAEHINVLEAAAVRNACSAFRERWSRGDSVLPRVDNTSALGSMRKGHSANAATAEAVADVALAMREDGIPVEWRYVASADNPADSVSREHA